jgi:hypothetical protein
MKKKSKSTKRGKVWATLVGDLEGSVASNPWNCFPWITDRPTEADVRWKRCVCSEEIASPLAIFNVTTNLHGYMKATCMMVMYFQIPINFYSFSVRSSCSVHSRSVRGASISFTIWSKNYPHDFLLQTDTFNLYFFLWIEGRLYISWGIVQLGLESF